MRGGVRVTPSLRGFAQPPRVPPLIIGVVVLCFCVFAGGGVFLGCCVSTGGGCFGGWLGRMFGCCVCVCCVCCGVCLCGLPGWVCLAVGLWQFGWLVVFGWG
jgi:hypothetical protein